MYINSRAGYGQYPTIAGGLGENLGIEVIAIRSMPRLWTLTYRILSWPIQVSYPKPRSIKYPLIKTIKQIKVIENLN